MSVFFWLSLHQSLHFVFFSWVNIRCIASGRVTFVTVVVHRAPFRCTVWKPLKMGSKDGLCRPTHTRCNDRNIKYLNANYNLRLYFFFYKTQINIPHYLCSWIRLNIWVCCVWEYFQYPWLYYHTFIIITRLSFYAALNLSECDASRI